MINYKLGPCSLPYKYDELEPIISKKIMELHYDKHYASYVNGANNALEKLQKMREGKIEGDVKSVMKDLSFNYNGAKLHELFWNIMRQPKKNNAPDEKARYIIEESFGTFEAFKSEFSEASKSVEGSGWGVLWQDKEGHLIIGQVEKHNLLGLNGLQPVLVLDVWEHAYYLDYENNRAAYVEKWWQVVNWDYVRHLLGEIVQVV